MKCKTSFFNKGILLNDLKRFSWIGIVYLIVLLFDIPLKILMTYSEENHYRSMKYLFNFDSQIQICLILIIPVLAAVILFRYIQSKKSVDMIHCLPIKREKIYDNHVLTGIVLLIMPVIIIAILSWILKITLDINNDDYTVRLVFSWAGTTILFNIIIFMFCVFIGMLTGLSTAQGIFTYIFLFLPVGLGILIIYNIKTFIYGLVYNHSIEYEIIKFSPLTRVLRLTSNTMKLNEIIIYIIFCIILFFAARFVYKKRKLETVSKAVAINKLQPVFKYGVTFCCMLVGGFYFGQIQRATIYWVLFGYAAASLIGYYIAEMIIKKSLKIFKNIKEYFIFAGVIIVLLIGINADIIGYEKRIPNLSNIESVYFDNGFYNYYENDNVETDDKENFFYEKENLQNIIKFNSNIIHNKKDNKFNNKNQERSVAFAYKLKDGKEIKREYVVPQKMYDEYFKPIYESKEYKIMNYDILSVDYNNIDKIRINAEDWDKQAVIIDPLEIKEALKILQNEIFNEKYEQNEYSRLRGWATISILLSDDTSLELEWDKSYTEFEKWLTRKGYLENSRVMPEDIKYVVVEKRNEDNPNQSEISIENKNVKRLDIYDKAKIETCLRNYCWRGRGEYILGFYSEDGENVFYGGLEDKYVPDFVKLYFQD